MADDNLSRTTSFYERRSPVVITFHQNNSEPTDSEFNDVFNRVNKLSGWFILIFILNFLPTFCVELGRASVETSKNIEGNCLFANLLLRNWSLMEIKRFTQPHRATYCEYLTFDYDKVLNMSFADAMTMKRNLRELPPAHECSLPVSEATVWSGANFLRSCASKQVKDSGMVYRTVGEIVSFIILGIISDTWGRKWGLYIAYPLLIIGYVFALVMDTYDELCAYYFFEGFGYQGLYLVTYVLFLELAHPGVRGILSLYVTSLETLANMTAFYIKLYTPTYYVSSILCVAPTLTLIFYLYYVPESPRWQLSYGLKKQAWRTLGTLDIDVSNLAFLPRISLPRFRLMIDTFQVLLFSKKYLRTLIGVGMIMCSERFLTLHIESYHFIKGLRVNSHRLIITIADIFSFFTVVPPFILFGRFVSILVMHCITILYFCLMFIVSEERDVYVVQIMSLVSLTSTRYVVLLYCCELFPTSARGTGLGLAWCLGRVLAILVSLGLYSDLSDYFTMTEQKYIFLAFGIFGFIGIMILPKVHVYNLPDYKRYRNVIET